jgi:sulfoxide reductase heme-binding subunit YedZ
MNPYIISVIFAAVFILFAALTAIAIKFEGGVTPSDPRKRKIWFWIFAIINPVIFYFVSAFVLAPDAENYPVEHDEFMAALPIAAGVGLVVYIVIGFVLSKLFKNGKIGNWF